MYQKSPRGTAWTKNEAEGGHSSCKSRLSRALLCEVVQVLPCPHASKPSSRCLLSAAFTPSNINMLVLCYTTGTLFTTQNHQLNMQGAGIGSYKTNHSLRATAVTRLYIVYTSLEWMSSWSWREPEIVALKVFAVTKTHSAKHFLTSSTALRKHELTLAKRSAVFPLFLPLQAPIQNTIDIGCLSPPCKFIFCVLNFRDWSQPQNYPDLW